MKFRVLLESNNGPKTMIWRLNYVEYMYNVFSDCPFYVSECFQIYLFLFLHKKRAPESNK